MLIENGVKEGAEKKNRTCMSDTYGHEHEDRPEVRRIPSGGHCRIPDNALRDVRGTSREEESQSSKVDDRREWIRGPPTVSHLVTCESAG